MTNKNETARIVTDRPRYKTIPLDWPIEFNGKTYTEINISRLTVADIASFAKALEDASADDSAMLPMYFDDQMNAVPKEVFDAMDVDDRDTIDQESLNFLPRRFRGLAEPSTTSKTGDTTEPMSAKN